MSGSGCTTTRYETNRLLGWIEGHLVVGSRYWSDFGVRHASRRGWIISALTRECAAAVSHPELA